MTAALSVSNLHARSTLTRQFVQILDHGQSGAAITFHICISRILQPQIYSSLSTSGQNSTGGGEQEYRAQSR